MNITLANLQRVAAHLPPEQQVKLSASLVSEQRAFEHIKAEVTRILHSPQGQQLIRRVQEHNKPRSYVMSRPDGMITRNGRTANLAQMQANLADSSRRLAELEKRVKRERAGYR